MKNEIILTVLEQLHRSSITGKYHSTNKYDQIRYQEISGLVETLYENIAGFDQVQIESVDKTGYLTPKIGVNGIIENKSGEILLEQRSDDKCWGIPGGWAEVGYTAEQNIQREMLEETGLHINVRKLVGVMSRIPSSRYPFTSYHLLFACEVTGGELKKSHESENIAWKSKDDVIKWHADHEDWLNYYFQQNL